MPSSDVANTCAALALPFIFCPNRKKNESFQKKLKLTMEASARTNASQNEPSTRGRSCRRSDHTKLKKASRERNRTTGRRERGFGLTQTAILSSSSSSNPPSFDVSYGFSLTVINTLVVFLSTPSASHTFPGIIMDRVKREGYTNDSYDHRREVASLKKDSDPWVSSSGFGLANILNRNNSSAPRSNMSTFNLPSLHSFGKSLLNKPEMPIARQNYEENRRFTSTRLQHHRRSVDLSPPQLSSPDSHRVTMAAAEEDKIDQDMDGTRSNNGTLSIRGGRWTADEHERFLEGFRIHGHKWKRVQQVVRTRSVTQVRTHAQKYLLKVAKLKAEKKQSGKTVDMATLAAEQSSRSTAAEVIDDHSTAPSTPEQGCSDQSPRKTPRKNVRRLDHGNCDPVDQEYIAAAATTLCFLMSQKIDSLLDTRHEPHVEVNKVEYEPYDCYAASSAIPSEVEHSRSRKRTYMHFITDQEDDYASSYDTARGERPSYTIEGKKLCS